MIGTKPSHTQPPFEPASGRPVESAEQWLGGNAGGATAEQRVWERLNPRHRKLLLHLARALALRQSPARLTEVERAKLAALVEELARLAARIELLLAPVTRRKSLPG